MIIFFIRFKASETGGRKLDEWKMKAPVIGKVIKLNLFGQFARTLGTLLQNGVPVLTALKITEQVMPNRLIKEAVAKTREAVTDGKTLAQPLAQSKLFPQLMVDLVRIGEETGDVPGALNNLADTYEGELAIALRLMTQLHGAGVDLRHGRHRGLPAAEHLPAVVPADFRNPLSPAMKTAAARPDPPRQAFTLIELMVVVAIIGLIAATGVPSILQTFRKEGMRKALADVQQVLVEARTRAIYSNRTTEVIFHPAEKRMEVADAPADASPMPLAGASADNPAPAPPPPSASGPVVLPDNVDIAMLDINLLDYGASEVAYVHFFPNGTCDELTLVLHSGDQWQKITLEFSTALATIGPLNR